MTVQDIINIIQTEGYNQFEMINNMNKNRVIGNKIKLTNNPVIRLSDYKSTRYHKAPVLCLELDRTQDLILQEYASDLATYENIKRARDSMYNWITCQSFKCAFSKDIDTFALKYGDIVINIKCKKTNRYTYLETESYPPRSTYNLTEIIGMLDPAYFDETNSFIDDKDRIFVLINTYALGKFDMNQVTQLQLEYHDLLNNTGTYNRSATPYIMYDSPNKQCFLGLWSLQEHRPLSKIKAENYKYRPEYIIPKIKESCIEFKNREVLSIEDFNVFGIELKGCVILK
jgi:hypothetical protein